MVDITYIGFEIAMNSYHFIEVASDLDNAGLVWQPEIGDEVSSREQLESVSILIDPQGMTPSQLRSSYLWLPSVEQMIMQMEARQAILKHAGLEMTDAALFYEAVVRYHQSEIHSRANSLRTALGLALLDLLLFNMKDRGGMH